jgi:aryl-alcohol dehydrogenase-like predicted oxidoreductase
MRIAGRATAHATRTALESANISDSWVRRLGRTGLSAAAVGFGTYRVDEADPNHAAALDRALARGLCLVDTAVNYGHGGAERAVGAALRRGIDAGTLKREGVIVVTKLGYWQGELLDWLRRAEHPDSPAIATLSDEHAHGLSPSLIRHAVEVSRERLGVQTLDVVLLHNPEYLLSPGPDALRDGTDGERRAAFDRTVGEAFGTLEALVSEGAIGWYGVSSNTLGAEISEPKHTSVDAFVGLAEAAATGRGEAEHHLAVMQAPLNFAETRGAEAAAACARHGLGFLANRPLNAVIDGALVRLAAPSDLDAAGEPLPEARRRLRKLEEAVATSGNDGFPRWSHELPDALRRLATALDFDDFVSRYARPRTEAALRGIAAPDAGRERALERWRDDYRAAFDALMASARAALATRDAARLQSLAQPLDDALVPGLRRGPLARRALAFAATRPGVTAALCGMRRVAWVDEALALVQTPR